MCCSKFKARWLMSLESKPGAWWKEEKDCLEDWSCWEAWAGGKLARGATVAIVTSSGWYGTVSVREAFFPLLRSFTRLTADRVLLSRSGGVYIITSAPGEAFSGVRAGRSRYPRGPQWILTARPAPTGTPGSSGPRGILPASDRSSAPQLSDKKQRISH